MKIRGFEPVVNGYLKGEGNFIMPERKTKASAGYDFSANEDVCIPKKSKIIIWTNIKAYMQEDEVLEIYIRSSTGLKYTLQLANLTGIIDSDYYGNRDNDGNIGIAFFNYGDEDINIKKGERIAQGIFKKYLTADSGNLFFERSGGIGSTNKTS